MASETLLGHSSVGVEAVYDSSIGNLEWSRNDYLKVSPSVTFLKELPATLSETMKPVKRLRLLI